MTAQSGYVNGKQTPTYRIWAGMKNRCLNPRNKDFRYYGGRGIAVCKRWMVFSNFLADMGERPAGLTIDRIDGTKGYGPANCRWASRREQRLNKPDVRFTGTPVDRLGITIHAVRARVRRGWPLDVAIAVKRSSRWSPKEKVA